MTTPAGQRWTRERPTEPGLYWFRKESRVGIVQITGPIVPGSNKDRYYQDGEWQGPITPDAYAAGRVAGETIETVTAWADEAFGPATLGRQIQRAKEELAELEAVAETANYLKIAEEAADVCICLFRVIGSIDATALQKKMAINRTRQWKVDGDGCAYHVKIQAQGGMR